MKFATEIHKNPLFFKILFSSYPNWFLAVVVCVCMCLCQGMVKAIAGVNTLVQIQVLCHTLALI